MQRAEYRMVLFPVLLPVVYDSFWSEMDCSHTQRNTNHNGGLLTGTVSLQVKTLYSSGQGVQHCFKRYSQLGFMNLLLCLSPSPFLTGEKMGVLSLCLTLSSPYCFLREITFLICTDIYSSLMVSILFLQTIKISRCNLYKVGPIPPNFCQPPVKFLDQAGKLRLKYMSKLSGVDWPCPHCLWRKQRSPIYAINWLWCK